MNNRALVAVLALWCALVVLPALIAVTALGLSGADGVLGGAAAGVCIGGFLVQFAVWLVVAGNSRGDAVVGWIIAALMPWIACAAAPVSLWWLVPCLGATAGYSAWFYRRQMRSRELQDHGIVAIGIVIDVIKPVMNVVTNSVYIKRALRLRVERGDGVPAYEVRYRGSFMLGDIPIAGDRLQLRVDPADPNNVDRDTGESAPVPRPSAFVARPRVAGTGLAKDLGRLADLHRRGDLSDREYARAKRRLTKP